MTSRELREKLELIRPACPHGIIIRSLLTVPKACAGTIKPCACCKNVVCKPSSHTDPWLCRGCTEEEAK